MSEHIEQFNKYCVEILGYSIGYIDNTNVAYYDEENLYVCLKNEFDPYNNNGQVAPVIDELSIRFGLTTNVDVIDQYGYTAAAHQLINNAIANHPLNDEGNLKTSEMVEENCMTDDEIGHHMVEMIRARQEENKMKEEDQIKTFNGHCAAIRGWTRSDDGIVYYTAVDEYVAEVENYNPHDNPRQLQPVLDILKDDYGLVPEGSSSHAARKLIWWYVAFGSECPKKEEDEDVIQLHHDLDVNSQYQEPPPVWHEPPIEDRVDEIFNALCINIVRTHSKSRGCSITLPKTFDPYNNTGNLIYVLEVVLKIVPDSITFKIGGGQNTDMVAEMRMFINTYGIDKYMLSEEDQFNKMCASFLEAGDIVDSQKFFDPYNITNDLTPIVSIIIETVGVGFTIEAPSTDYDIHNRLRAYAQEYGQEALDLMEDV